DFTWLLPNLAPPNRIANQLMCQRSLWIPFLPPIGRSVKVFPTLHPTCAIHSRQCICMLAPILHLIQFPTGFATRSISMKRPVEFGQHFFLPTLRTALQPRHILPSEVARALPSLDFRLCNGGFTSRSRWIRLPRCLHGLLHFEFLACLKCLLDLGATTRPHR